MTKLPVTLEAAEAAELEKMALAFARQLVRTFKSSTGWGKHWLKAAAANPRWTSDICNLAREGSGLADEAVRELIVECDQRRQEPLMAVRQYGAEIVQAGGRLPRRGGWDKSAGFLRDMMVMCIIKHVCGVFSLPPTRSRSSRREGLSSCRIVAMALAAEREGISEAAVVTIWTRYRARADTFLLDIG